MENIEFGTKLTRLMESKGISQTLLAKFCRTTQQTVSRWCKGQCEPDINNIYIICAVLDETPNELFEYDEAEARSFVKKAVEQIVGHSKEFQKEQALIEKELLKQGKAELIEERCEELFQEYLRRFYSKNLSLDKKPSDNG